MRSLMLGNKAFAFDGPIRSKSVRCCRIEVMALCWPEPNAKINYTFLFLIDFGLFI